MEKKVVISEKEYKELKKYNEVDRELLEEIAAGIKDILKGRVKEINDSILSESSLAKEWLTPEEDEAWKSL